MPVLVPHWHMTSGWNNVNFSNSKLKFKLAAASTLISTWFCGTGILCKKALEGWKVFRWPSCKISDKKIAKFHGSHTKRSVSELQPRNLPEAYKIRSSVDFPTRGHWCRWFFDVFFYLYKLLNKQLNCWWSETLLRSNDVTVKLNMILDF